MKRIRVDGCCDAFFNEKILHVRDADWRVDVKRGAQLKVRARENVR